MKKTFSSSLILLGLVLLRPQQTTAQQQPPPEDPLGRSTPQGTVVGLARAALQEDLERAAHYLDSTLEAPERQELARKLGVVLDRRLFTSLDALSRSPDGDPNDGLRAGRDRVGTVRSASGNVEIVLDRVQRGGDNPVWLFPSDTSQEIPRLYDELAPLWFERYAPEWLRNARLLSMSLYRTIIFLLAIPLIFGLASLSTRALAALLGPPLRRLTRSRTTASIWPDSWGHCACRFSPCSSTSPPSSGSR